MTYCTIERFVFLTILSIPETYNVGCKIQKQTNSHQFIE